jgi:CrcB protein
MTFMKFACFGLAGAAGALARLWLAELFTRHAASHMPWGTWAVNLVGCFFFGFVWTLAEERNAVSPEFRFFVLAGFMGAFTTFSSYIFESVDLVRNGAVAYAIINIIGQNLAGVISLLAGMAIARSVG